MKKILLIVLIIFSWNNLALSQTQTYNCKKLYGYIEDDWKYVATFSDETATLIMENNVFYDEWGSLRSGYATLIYNNEKIEFTQSNFGEAYAYRKIDDDDAKSSKTFKKLKGKLSYVSFLRLTSQYENKNYFDLDYSKADTLWSMETKGNQMQFRVHRFVCKIN